ncbi:hypothetical protein [Psittacicella hinzii]|uniref:Uncharacterized protein n=1 Tax=Psittacicella hinzii TaxID=2028575 RepID=A0A3A1YD35_9GAMM|nr:hypothetical protein [Psittacicella hinzii]RIY36163.1 hypothetical protein CKF58_06220 [Psittacicella hinzii]
MTKKVNFSEASLEDLADSHVYVPDMDTDYHSYHTGKSIKTIKNPNPHLPTKVTNTLNLPPFCTATMNPGAGSTLTITYTAKEKLLEVFTLEKYINSFIGHKIVRDVEYLAQEIASEVALALDNEVKVEAEFILVGFKYGQSVHCQIEVNQAAIKLLKQEYKNKYLEFAQKAAQGQIPEFKDTQTFMERVAEQTASKCPVDHQALAQENAVVDNASSVTKDKKASKATKGKKGKGVDSNSPYADAKVCPFVPKEKAQPGAKCPVTGLSYEDVEE